MIIKEHDIINLIDIYGDRIPVTVIEVTDSYLTIMKGNNKFRYGLFTQYLTNKQTSQCIKTRGIESLK